MNVHVKAKAPLARRCRCGYCFDAEGQEIHVSVMELAALNADPMLVVTELKAPKAPADGDPGAPADDGDPEPTEEPENAAPEGNMPEDEAAEGEAHA
ncbi:MAG: hypothetical protein K2J64_07940 [Desulfovibrio sp.]|nr:hypothetical protein [Desulfovibrio sp.]